MKKNVKLAVLFLILAPFLSSCNSKKLEEENAELKRQIDTFTNERASTDAKVSELMAEVDSLKIELTKNQDELNKTQETIKGYELAKAKADEKAKKAAAAAPKTKKAVAAKKEKPKAAYNKKKHKS